MSDTGADPAPDGGAGSRRYLLVSDFHLGWEPDGADDVFDALDGYRQEYDCDGLVIGGDLDARDGEFSDLLDLEFDRTMIALGNHDGSNGSGTDGSIDPYADVMIDGDDVYWEAVVEETTYSFEMSHRPDAFNLTAHSSQDGKKQPDATDSDICLYGHSHMPYDRVIDDTLYIGLGSTYQNYNTDDRVLPEASFHILDLGPDDVSLRHHDFEDGELVEEATYERTDDGLELASAIWTWRRDRSDRWS